MQLQQNISLKSYNTFGIDMPAEYFIELKDTELLAEISTDKTLPPPKHALGGGSNILLTKPVKGLVIRNLLKGIVIERENEEHVWLNVMAGEVWHDLVMFAIGKGWAGIENLALIPGCVGAAPIQNIGAYGVEAKETIDAVTGWHWEDKTIFSIKNADCNFGYRDSIFKHSLRDKVFITSVVFRLDKKPSFHTSYGQVKQELEKMNVQELSIKSVAEAVINIRSSKLPDPKKTGNAGSFFKNPTVSLQHFELLQTNYPDIRCYPYNETMVKVPAAWLIEKCGWKGYRKDGFGVHEKQALVLVNYGNAKGMDIWNLSGEIVESVNHRFGISLEREVQVW